MLLSADRLWLPGEASGRGELEVEDYTTRFAIGGGLNVNGFRDSLSMQMKETVNRGFEVYFAERAGISGFSRPVEMEGV